MPGAVHRSSDRWRTAGPRRSWPPNAARRLATQPRRETSMATFMDVHYGFVGVTAQQLKEAHERDLAIEKDEGVHFESAWLDPCRARSSASRPARAAKASCGSTSGPGTRRPRSTSSRSRSTDRSGAAPPRPGSRPPRRRSRRGTGSARGRSAVALVAWPDRFLAPASIENGYGTHGLPCSVSYSTMTSRPPAAMEERIAPRVASRSRTKWSVFAASTPSKVRTGWSRCSRRRVSQGASPGIAVGPPRPRLGAPPSRSDARMSAPAPRSSAWASVTLPSLPRARATEGRRRLTPARISATWSRGSPRSRPGRARAELRRSRPARRATPRSSSRRRPCRPRSWSAAAAARPSRIVSSVMMHLRMSVALRDVVHHLEERLLDDRAQRARAGLAVQRDLGRGRAARPA